MYPALLPRNFSEGMYPAVSPANGSIAGAAGADSPAKARGSTAVLTCSLRWCADVRRLLRSCERFFFPDGGGDIGDGRTGSTPAGFDSLPSVLTGATTMLAAGATATAVEAGTTTRAVEAAALGSAAATAPGGDAGAAGSAGAPMTSRSSSSLSSSLSPTIAPPFSTINGAAAPSCNGASSAVSCIGASYSASSAGSEAAAIMLTRCCTLAKRSLTVRRSTAAGLIMHRRSRSRRSLSLYMARLSSFLIFSLFFAASGSTSSSSSSCSCVCSPHSFFVRASSTLPPARRNSSSSSKSSSRISLEPLGNPCSSSSSSLPSRASPPSNSSSELAWSPATATSCL
mmetsp:Transcript_42270/g.99675  ORF Transcript_42270/g.99675 Transcript_42270/m.99675 type:complete len:342 (+) Transcript_42270:496-1521(+)